MKAVLHREIEQFFLTPIGYVFIGIFSLMSGLFFTVFNMKSSTSDLDTLFGNLIYLFMIISPLLTMRLISEEKRNKTDQLLLTSPLSINKIIIGKYCASLFVFIIALILTAPFIVIIAVYAVPYYGLIASNYIGFFLIGSCYIAIGEWLSSLTESQIIAAVLTYAIIILLQVLESIGPSLSISSFEFLSSAFSFCSLYHRYFTFTQGIVSVSNIFFFLSLDAFILMLTILTMASKRRKS